MRKGVQTTNLWLLALNEQNQNEGHILGWSEAHLKLGIEFFDLLEVASESKSEEASEQFLMDNLSLKVGGGLTRSNLEVSVSILPFFIILIFLFSQWILIHCSFPLGDHPLFFSLESTPGKHTHTLHLGLNFGRQGKSSLITHSWTITHPENSLLDIRGRRNGFSWHELR